MSPEIGELVLSLFNSITCLIVLLKSQHHQATLTLSKDGSIQHDFETSIYCPSERSKVIIYEILLVKQTHFLRYLRTGLPLPRLLGLPPSSTRGQPPVDQHLVEPLLHLCSRHLRFHLPTLNFLLRRS